MKQENKMLGLMVREQRENGDTRVRRACADTGSREGRDCGFVQPLAVKPQFTMQHHLVEESHRVRDFC